MKVPSIARRVARRSLGIGSARPIAPRELQTLAAQEPVVVVAVGIVSAGAIDPGLPGEQRAASLVTLAEVVRDVPRQQPIVLHCG